METQQFGLWTPPGNDRNYVVVGCSRATSQLSGMYHSAARARARVMRLLALLLRRILRTSGGPGCLLVVAGAVVVVVHFRRRSVLPSECF